MRVCGVFLFFFLFCSSFVQNTKYQIMKIKLSREYICECAQLWIDGSEFRVYDWKILSGIVLHFISFWKAITRTYPFYWHLYDIFKGRKIVVVSKPIGSAFNFKFNFKIRVQHNLSAANANLLSTNFVLLFIFFLSLSFKMYRLIGRKCGRNGCSVSVCSIFCCFSLACVCVIMCVRVSVCVFYFFLFW